MDHFSLDRTEVPVYSHLFSLCGGSFKKAWTFQGIVAGPEKNFTMSSMGGQRL
jgi:hypothetical protein